MHLRFASALTVLVLVALGAGGCGKGAPPQSPSGRPPAMADGKHYGRIQSVSETPPQIEVHLKEFLTGDAALKQAKADGCKEGRWCTPDGYWVHNLDKSATVPVEPTAEVGVLPQAGIAEPVPITFAQLAKRFSQSPPARMNEHLHYLGFWFWTKDGRIVKLQEQFQP